MKHKWMMCGYKDIPDKINVFAAENMPSDFHNGPKCEKCGFEFCHHCNPEGYETKCGAKSIKANPKNTKKAEVSYKKLIKKLRSNN